MIKLTGLLLLVASAPLLAAESGVRVELDTQLGPIRVEVLPQAAPLSACDFLAYTDRGLYSNASFYRVVRLDNDHGSPKIEVVQGGLPDDAKGLPPIKHETTQQTGLKHVDGALSLARGAVGTGGASAFFIVIGNQPGLDYGAMRNKDGQGFAVFGRVVSGMDIVKRAVVDELGGALSLRTTPDAGTTFTLLIPLTISIVDAFSFVCGEQIFVAPVAAIEEIVEVGQEALVRGPSGRTRLGDMRFMERRGEIVPLVNLASVFSLACGDDPKALVVRRNGTPFAFGIQRMVGQQEVVIRPLDDALVKVPGVSGSTDLGDGRPTLVLDLVALSSAISHNRAEVSL